MPMRGVPPSKRPPDVDDSKRGDDRETPAILRADEALEPEPGANVKPLLRAQ